MHRSLLLVPGRWSAHTIARFGDAARHASTSEEEAAEVVIALGSNLGNRGRHLLQGLRSLQQHGVQVLRHSALYETVPAYVADQPSFFNAACLARTQLPPLELLATLKRIEAEAGRDLSGGIRFGPRPLDMDIIFYNGIRLDHDKLQIPHPRWQERSFVKAPVADLYRPLEAAESKATPSAAGSRQAAPATGLTLHKQLAQLHQLWTEHVSTPAAASASATGGQATGSEEGTPTPTGAPAGSLPVGQGEIMRRVMPLPRGGLLAWGQRTYMMGILNATPDSFSDGGLLMAGGVQGAVQRARQMVGEGADILDVGGQSTRPGATRLSEGEEAARAVPLIRALRQDAELKDVLVSIDTFYASVAKAAVEAGADMVNDVSGGTLDSGMLLQVAELGVPYILMHMRGDPTTMQHASNVQYDCTWRDVGAELQAQADVAMSAGIPAWNLVLDPGIGFSKTAEGNLELVRHLGDMRRHVLQGAFKQGALLVGPSRKGFLGKLTGRTQPAERDAATVACAVACVGGGGLADIVRAHNVRDVVDGLRVADALYRTGF